MHRVRDLLQECPTLSRNSTAIDVEWTTRFNSELSTLFNISRRTGCICVTAVDRIDLILHYRCTFCRQFYDRVYCNYQLCCRLTIKYISWRPMIYFAFVHSHLLYGVEVYANTTTNHLSKLITLNNKLLRILQYKSLKHIIQNYIKLILLCHWNYCIIVKYCYLFKNTCIIEVSCLLFFLPILKKIHYCTAIILGKKRLPQVCCAVWNWKKRPLNIGAVSYGIIYLMTSKTLHHYYLLNIN